MEHGWPALKNKGSKPTWNSATTMMSLHRMEAGALEGSIIVLAHTAGPD